MHSTFSRRLARATLVLGGVAVAAVGGTAWATAGTSSTASAVSAPASSASSGTGSSSSPTSSASASASASSSASASAGAVTVTMKNGPMGAYLTDGEGRSLYLFLADKNGKSNCNGACAEAWPPLTTSSKASAGSGVTAGMLGTTTRSDGSKQVTYNGHPLYHYSLDKAAGNTNGQGVNAFGALWWLVSPSGTPITSTSSGGATPGASGTTGGRGY